MKSQTDFISAVTKSSSQEVISKQKKTLLEKSAFFHWGAQSWQLQNVQKWTRDFILQWRLISWTNQLVSSCWRPLVYTMQIWVQGQSCFNQWAWHVAQCECDALQLWCEGDWFKTGLGKVPLLQRDAKRGKTSVTIYNNVTRDIKDNRKRSRQ